MEEESTGPGLEPFEERVSQGKYVAELGVMTLFLGFSVVLVMTGLVERDSGVFRDTLATIAGLIFAPIAAWACHNVLQFLRDPRPALQITEQGILNRTVWSSVTLVPWEEVIDIKKTRRSWNLEIVLRDPEAFRERQSWTTRALMRLRVLMGRDTLPIYLPQLDAPRKKVARKLLEAMEAREIAAVRENRLLEGPNDGPPASLEPPLHGEPSEDQ